MDVEDVLEKMQHDPRPGALLQMVGCIAREEWI